MFHNIIGTARRVDLPLSWHHINLQRFFPVSLSREYGNWSLVPPEGRRRVYDYQVERYNKNSEIRSDKQLRSLAYMRARRISLSEERKRYLVLRESFRMFVKPRLEKGRLPDWETHVPEFVDDSVVHHCGSCGRVHYKGRTKIWWRSKQDESYECNPCFTKDFTKVTPVDHESRKLFKNMLEWRQRQNQTSEAPCPEPDSDQDLTS